MTVRTHEIALCDLSFNARYGPRLRHQRAYTCNFLASYVVEIHCNGGKLAAAIGTHSSLLYLRYSSIIRPAKLALIDPRPLAPTRAILGVVFTFSVIPARPGIDFFARFGRHTTLMVSPHVPGKCFLIVPALSAATAWPARAMKRTAGLPGWITGPRAKKFSSLLASRWPGSPIE